MPALQCPDGVVAYRCWRVPRSFEEVFTQVRVTCAGESELGADTDAHVGVFQEVEQGGDTIGKPVLEQLRCLGDRRVLYSLWIEQGVDVAPVGALPSAAESGEPVLLLHGFPSSNWQWREQLEALGLAGYRAVAPNQRGYSAGARPAAVAAYTMPNLILGVTSMADALGWERRCRRMTPSGPRRIDRSSSS